MRRTTTSRGSSELAHPQQQDAKEKVSLSRVRWRFWRSRRYWGELTNPYIFEAWPNSLDPFPTPQSKSEEMKNYNHLSLSVLKPGTTHPITPGMHAIAGVPEIGDAVLSASVCCGSLKKKPIDSWEFVIQFDQQQWCSNCFHPVSIIVVTVSVKLNMESTIFCCSSALIASPISKLSYDFPHIRWMMQHHAMQWWTVIWNSVTLLIVRNYSTFELIFPNWFYMSVCVPDFSRWDKVGPPASFLSCPNTSNEITTGWAGQENVEMCMCSEVSLPPFGRISVFHGSII